MTDTPQTALPYYSLRTRISEEFDRLASTASAAASLTGCPAFNTGIPPDTLAHGGIMTGKCAQAAKACLACLSARRNTASGSGPLGPVTCIVR